MKLKLDESLTPHLKLILTQLGHDVSTARDEGLQGKPDDRVAEAARSEERLLTLDVDFGDLRRFPPGSHWGIIVLRLGSQSVERVSQFVENFFRTTDVESLRGCLVVAEPSRTRIRWPDRPEQGN